MAEDVRQDQFRCDYCGELHPLRDARIWWEWAESLTDGTERFVAATYCSDFCGDTHTAGSVGRG